MADKKLQSLTFIGRPFPDGMMDAQRTFTKSNLEMEKDENFQKFLKDNNLADHRTVMIDFGPDHFMYWYGIVTDQKVEVPKGLMKFVLPEAEVAQEESNGNLTNFNLPLNYIVPTFFKALTDRGIEVYENPGDSETPYFLQDLNLTTKKLVQTWYLKASK